MITKRGFNISKVTFYSSIALCASALSMTAGYLTGAYLPLIQSVV